MYARETEVVESINDPNVRENTTFLKVISETCLAHHSALHRLCDQLLAQIKPRPVISVPRRSYAAKPFRHRIMACRALQTNICCYTAGA